MKRTLKITAILATTAMFWGCIARNSEANYLTPSSVDAPGQIIAGEPLTIAVTMPAAGPARILVFSGASVFEFTPELPAGPSNWTVPEAISQTAGRLSLLIDESQLDVVITPGSPTRFTEVLLGPRTIVADGTDSSLAVVVPGDIYGNGLAEGTEVSFERLNQDKIRSTADQLITRSIAWARLDAGTRAGTNSVWVTLGAISGVPAVLTEVPGTAASVQLDLTSPTVVADGRQVIELATLALVDAHGNQLPDGIAGVFQLSTDTSTTVVPATVQRGRLRAFWTAPNRPQVLTITASINGQTSESALITATSGVLPFDVGGRKEADGYRIDAGPIFAPSGALIADGTEVKVGDRTTTTTDGYASVLVEPDSMMVTVEILGFSATHRIQQ